MDVSTTIRISSRCCHKLPHEYSLRKCSSFLLILLLFLVVAAAAAAFTVFVVLKPRKPVFSLQRIALDSYKLEADSGPNTLSVSSVISLNLNARNPNKVGIKYGRSRLFILAGEGLPVGVIRVRGFYQPAHSHNVSVHARVVLESVNVTQIISGAASSLHSHGDSNNDNNDNNNNDNAFHMRILGDIRVHFRVLRVTLPKTKVEVDCDIRVDYGELIPINQIFSMKAVQNHMASVANKIQTFSEKCSLALYI